ncbi:MAG: hydantoinase B/oxoprolinase family protein [Alphaproteobacteria bacterium]|nr:MAG: hydantoinase B/oxoprolinase family protein [Alphaproteobacteria bacterium]
MTEHQPVTAVAIDPITVEVIGNALSSIVEEMGETLIRAAYSTNIKERRDCSTALFNAEGQCLAQAEHVPIHLGSFIGLIEAIYARIDLTDIREGDVFIGNDAYTGGGTHLPDIVLAAPIFVEGRLMAWAVNLAHHADFVDRSHAHIFQEGIRIPPVRLYREGVLQQDMLDLILLNCQVPRERLNDLRAQMAANRTGITRFRALCERHGTSVVRAAAAALLDYAERRMRAGIASVPDGTYDFEDRFDYHEFDGELTFRISVTVAGDDIHLDFTDNPAQLRSGVNLVRTATLATVYYAIKTVMDPDAPPNAGLYRPIHVKTKPGTIIHATEPAAVDGRMQASARVVDLVHGALAKAVPERLTAAHNGACIAAIFSGAHPRTGAYYVYLETIGGGFGARATKDGLDGVHVHTTNTSNLPVEALEPEYPLVIEAYELVDDSGGAGRWRGGMGLRRRVRVEHDGCHVSVHHSRKLSAPWGLMGGTEGGRFALRITGPGGPLIRGEGDFDAGAVVEVTTPGAGGYGNPAERDAWRVTQDLEDGRISAETALKHYKRQMEERR